MSSYNSFGTINHPNTESSSPFETNNKNNNPGASIFGNSGSSLFPNINNQNNQNNNTIFGRANQNNLSNNQNQNHANNITMFNLSNIDKNQNQNQIFFNNQNNNNNLPQNQFLDLNNHKKQHDLVEYQEALININKCFNPYERENMFKDYLYMPIPKGKSPNEYNKYRPYSYLENQRIKNDYKIWEEATKNNKNPNEFFPIQIASVNTILNRHKCLEKGILKSFIIIIDNEKNLETLNKKIDDEMNNKISDLKIVI